jgi:hypothetical protein
VLVVQKTWWLADASPVISRRRPAVYGIGVLRLIGIWEGSGSVDVPIHRQLCYIETIELRTRFPDQVLDWPGYPNIGGGDPSPATCCQKLPDKRPRQSPCHPIGSTHQFRTKIVTSVICSMCSYRLALSGQPSSPPWLATHSKPSLRR